MASGNGALPVDGQAFDSEADINIGDGDGGRAPGSHGGSPAAKRPGASRLAAGSPRLPVASNSSAGRAAAKRIESLKSRAITRIVYPPDDEHFECSFPNLWEGMTMFQYADGTPRMQWEITIRRISQGYVAAITDHDLLQKLRVSVLRYEDIQQALESQLVAPNPGWESMEKSYRNKKGLGKFDKKG